MEIGDEDFDYAILEARGNDNLRGGMKRLARVAVEILADFAQGGYSVEWGSAICSKASGILVWLPLHDMQIFFGEIGIVV